MGLNNNDILKKLRVALKLRDDDIVEILKLVDFKISKGELGAFFRREDHPSYMKLKDQILRNFLNGLVIYYRGAMPQKPGQGDVENKGVAPGKIENKKDIPKKHDSNKLAYKKDGPKRDDSKRPDYKKDAPKKWAAKPDQKDSGINRWTGKPSRKRIGKK